MAEVGDLIFSEFSFPVEHEQAALSALLRASDLVIRSIKHANHDRHSFRFASSNGMTRSTLPVESKIRTSPERKHARVCA
jgi:hypothetical protein